MAEQGKGLRFDIYERIHLADDAIGISELLEADLIPHIQVITQDNQAVLRGNLLLNGQYIGEGDHDKQTLEYLIPVEITLPMSRISRIEDVLVEIENFDIELLSTRNVNVTGVLSLHGVEVSSVSSDSSIHAIEEAVETVEPAEIADSLQLDKGLEVFLHKPWEVEEEVTFTHQAGDREEKARISMEIPPNVPSDQDSVHTEELRIEDAIEEQTPTISEPYPANESISFVTSHVTPDYTLDLETRDEAEQPEIAELAADPIADEPVIETEVELREEEESEDETPDLQAVEQSKELKVAFGSRPSEDLFTREQPASVRSLIKSEEPQEQAAIETVEQAVEEPQSAPRTDALEWRKLFVRDDSQEQQFRKVKMCIVQKEDTLENIATRYGVNERTLLQYNRLDNLELQTGQILYIPYKM